MSFVAARGMVLGATAYAEADKIVQLYTLQLGRVRAIVKGIRKPKSKLASSIDLFTESTFSLHKKASGSFYVLGQAKILNGYAGLKKEFVQITTLQVLAEMVSQATPEGETHSEIYDLLKEILNALEKEPKSNEILLMAFALKLMEFLGYPLELEICSECGETLERKKVYLIPHRGGALCESCQGSGTVRFQVTPVGLEVLKKLRRIPMDRVHVLKLKPHFSRQLLFTVIGYLERTFEKSFKTLEYYSKVLPLERE
jgi:DNA repair protein RecO (recombination protein O)